MVFPSHVLGGWAHLNIANRAGMQALGYTHVRWGESLTVHVHSLSLSLSAILMVCWEVSSIAKGWWWWKYINLVFLLSSFPFLPLPSLLLLLLLLSVLVSYLSSLCNFSSSSCVNYSGFLYVLILFYDRLFLLLDFSSCLPSFTFSLYHHPFESFPFLFSIIFLLLISFVYIFPLVLHLSFLPHVSLRIVRL